MRWKVRLKMNKVFLSGKIRRVPDVAYTPKGRKIVTFPLLVAEGELQRSTWWARARPSGGAGRRGWGDSPGGRGAGQGQAQVP